MNLKKIIKEELDDFWQNVREMKPSIWFTYQMLLFDEDPTKTEVIKFINDALNSGLVSAEAIDSWMDEGVEDESEIIYEAALRGNSPYLRIDLNTKWLYYGEDYQYVVNNYPDLRKINFSEAKNYSINESEDEWDWVRELPVTIGPKNRPKKGDVLICLPGFEGYGESDDEDDPNNGGSGYASGRIIVVGEITEFKSIEPGKKLVIWPDENESRKYWNSDMYCFDCGIYGMALTYYNQSLTESTGFEWIDDITPEDIKFKVGDTIKVKNNGSERSFLNWLGDYSSSYISGEYGIDIIGVVNSVGQQAFTLIERGSGDRITFPNPDKIKNHVDYKYLDLSYELLNTDY